ncbi:MFS transporter [Ideonella sp. BN130291]|uniref:MFS transporter n=1 Tax=Ideonella sp. BN130291 TaxID=3112940 RepID=UPI002E25401A|nr:MFS transporter [Ideonella sp. BN130291]
MTASALFAHPSFIRFWAGRLAGTMASQMLMVAVGWQMYELTGSAWDLGLVGLYQFVPALALTLVSGHVADRYDRRRVVAAALALQTLAALLLVLATGQGWASRSLILGVSFGLGVAKAFQMTSQAALAPLLVPAALLPRALAFNSAGMQVAIIGGPALGGLIYALGAAVVYAVCAALFVAGTVLMLSVRHEHAPGPRAPVTLDTLFAGVRFIWQRPAVLGAISLDLFAVLLGGATALLPIFARDILHVGPWGLGLLRGAPAVGALVMSVVLARWAIQRRVGHVLFASVAVYGIATLVFGVSTVFWLSFAALFVAGAADMVSVVIRQSLVQLDTPDEMRGRVSAVNSVFIGASNQLGEFESGATAALLGPVGSVLLGGAGTLLVVVLWMRWFPQLAQRQQLTEAR